MKYPKLSELLMQEHNAGKSIREVCKKAGIATASFYNYVHGDTTPDVDTLERIANNFGVSVAFLVSEQPEQYNPSPSLSTEKTLLWDLVNQMTDDEALELVLELRKRRKGQESA